LKIFLIFIVFYQDLLIIDEDLIKTLKIINSMIGYYYKIHSDLKGAARYLSINRLTDPS